MAPGDDRQRGDHPQHAAGHVQAQADQRVRSRGSKPRSPANISGSPLPEQRQVGQGERPVQHALGDG